MRLPNAQKTSGASKPGVAGCSAAAEAGEDSAGPISDTELEADANCDMPGPVKGASEGFSLKDGGGGNPEGPSWGRLPEVEVEAAGWADMAEATAAWERACGCIAHALSTF